MRLLDGMSLTRHGQGRWFTATRLTLQHFRSDEVRAADACLADPSPDQEYFMKHHYATADVFTSRPLSGNPVAVVLDAEGLTDAQMQALAAEFNYTETTFVLPPNDPANTARVRIFTLDRELAFAGHPNLGTAFLMAREQLAAAEQPPSRYLFEESAGLVAVDLLHEGESVVGAELLAPQPLVRGETVDAFAAAACLGLAALDVRTDTHRPTVVSVGLPFLVLELASRSALHHARPNREGFEATLPLDGARSVYAYVRGHEGEAHDIHARMFTGQMVEDPATGSAAAAATAFLAFLRAETLSLRVLQGEDMGRPSTLLTRGTTVSGAVRGYVGGQCIAMFTGSFELC
jgi:trans-2,3-dihydro-3-hydroxyanthranilate isomerase